MRAATVVLVVLLGVAAAPAQSPDPLLSDTRLTVHTLVREDIFAGFMRNDAAAVSRAEANIDTLMKLRPGERANLLAWRSAAAMFHAVTAHTTGNTADFMRHFTLAQQGFAEAATLSTGNDGVVAITGGTYSVYADRLPAEHRGAAWQEAWRSYSMLWRQQGARIADMPIHFQGEVLAGLTQSAQRTGRTAEATEFLDKMLVHLGNTPYEPMAKKWKEDPASAATTNLTCKNCHNSGRLAAKVKALEKGNQ
jgi:hypothetical protein